MVPLPLPALALAHDYHPADDVLTAKAEPDSTPENTSMKMARADPLGLRMSAIPRVICSPSHRQHDTFQSPSGIVGLVSLMWISRRVGADQ